MAVGDYGVVAKRIHVARARAITVPLGSNRAEALNILRPSSISRHDITTHCSDSRAWPIRTPALHRSRNNARERNDSGGCDDLIGVAQFGPTLDVGQIEPCSAIRPEQ